MIKIYADTEELKNQILEESEYIHYLTEIDSDKAGLLMHLYMNPDVVTVEPLKNEMEWISTKGMTNETAPDEGVLVQYIEPFFDSFAVEFAMAYFDNPLDYENGIGEGWKHSCTENQISVISYCILKQTEKFTDNIYSKMTQEEFMKISDNIKLGCIGE